ncbi:glycosyltransferase family 25 protein [uncultured Martelella sp.]|uniref:glycosyltransferase family 25 protein n=1 Tax=uncultured Martelella sp. TaxID=392331 RepID=UPI0029C6FEF3|nr:glycosyltransferase family 25 protein [uncultured Martelella sp.]
MLTFVINLDREVDRLSYIERMMAAREIRFTRIAATDARLICNEEMRALSAFPLAFSREMTCGEIGCYLSHVCAWKKLLESDAPAAAVFEDDVELSGAARDVLADLENLLPPEIDIVKLETSRKPTEMARQAEVRLGAYEVRQLVGCHIGSAGYVITRQGAEKMLERSAKLSVPIDAALFDPRAGIRQGLSIMQLVPALCIQTPYDQSGPIGIHMGSAITERGKRKSYGRTLPEIAFNRTKDRIAVISSRVAAVIARRRCSIVEYRP